SASGTDAGTRNGGSIAVQAPQVTLTGGAQIRSATSGPGQGGTVTITATDLLSLAGTSPDGRVPSSIFALNGGTGNGGSIVVQAPRVTLTEGAQIRSVTSGKGQGALLQVTAADTLTLVGTSPDGRLPSSITASTRGTDAGAGTAG